MSRNDWAWLWSMFSTAIHFMCLCLWKFNALEIYLPVFNVLIKKLRSIRSQELFNRIIFKMRSYHFIRNNRYYLTYVLFLRSFFRHFKVTFNFWPYFSENACFFAPASLILSQKKLWVTSSDSHFGIDKFSDNLCFCSQRNRSFLLLAPLFASIQGETFKEWWLQPNLGVHKRIACLTWYFALQRTSSLVFNKTWRSSVVGAEIWDIFG